MIYLILNVYLTSYAFALLQYLHIYTTYEFNQKNEPFVKV